VKKALLLTGLLALAQAGFSQWNAASLGGFGVATLSDRSVGARLGARFRAAGDPVFLIGNLSLGLQQGDMIRFANKAVLIDADVWQTLRTEGALAALKVAPVVRVKARAQRTAWQGRSQAVSGQEKKAYELGERLLASMEGAMPVLPDGQKLSIAFEGGQMVLSVPPGFLDRFRMPRGGEGARDEKIPASVKGLPLIVSTPPRSVFAGIPLRWEVWAVDASGGPTGEVRLRLDGALPPGLAWNEAAHALEGTPTTEGTWPLTVRATNNQGSDTLAALLQVRRNHAPRFLNAPGQAEVARPWNFTPLIHDLDHSASEVVLLPRRIPDGAKWDSATATVSWTPKDTGETLLQLTAIDALGDSTVAKWPLLVRTPNLRLVSDGMRLSTPWDTLRAGRTYRWSPGTQLERWNAEGLRPVKVEGSDSLRWNGSELILSPKAAGDFAVTFVLERNGKPFPVGTVLPVRLDAPPVFLSELGTSVLKAGQSASYRPVAVSPEGDLVTLRVKLPAGSPLHWDSTHLSLGKAPPGTHAAEVIARDRNGNETHQWVAWTVEPGPQYHGFLQTRYARDQETWTVGLESGIGRIGLFTPSAGRLFGWNRMVDQEWPYIFVGANFLPQSLRERGNSLVGDLGFTLRAPKTSFYTGGVYGRIAGHFTSMLPFRWETDAEVQGWIRQTLMVADSNVIKTIDFSGTGQKAKTNDSRWTLDQVVTVQNRYWSVMNKVMHDQSAADNIVLSSHVDAWIPVGAGLQTGLGLWRMDMPVAKVSEQTLGAGLRGRWKLGALEIEPSSMAGWGPQGAGFSVCGSLLVTLGH